MHHLIRVGYRVINLEYLIETADSALGAPPSEVPPGKIRVSIYPGKTFDVEGKAAAQLRLHLDDNVKPLPSDLGHDGKATHRPTRRGRSSVLPSDKPREEYIAASESETGTSMSTVQIPDSDASQ